jgi:beta-lactamase regulating signal transducer with metallopeptidase domain
MTLSLIYDHLWQSTVFAAAAGLFTLAFRKNRARVRHGLWLAASMKFLIPLAVLIELGDRIPWHRVPSSELSAVVVAMSEPFTMPLASAPTLAATPVVPAANPLPAMMAAIWAVGFLAIACSWFVRWRTIAAVVRAGSPVPLGLPIPALASPSLLEPGVFGVANPVLLLPASLFERLTPDQLNAVIAHEMYHVRRRDNLVAAFHMFVETAFWFHPVVWWIGRRMLEERERACDEGVLSTGSEPRLYAEAVLSVCKLYVEIPLECVSGVAGGNLKGRIEAIMTKRIAHDLHFAKKLGLAIAAMATLLAPVFIGMLHSPAALAQAVAPAPLPAPVAVAVAAQAPAAKPRPRTMPAVAMVPQVAVQAPQVAVQAKGVAEPQISPGTTPNEAKKIRTDWAQANLPNRAMAYAYGLFGPPNRKDSRGTVEIWDYDFLEDYQSRVTLEFSSSAQSGPRITWPAQTTFEAGGQNDVAGVAVLANELGRQMHQDTSAPPRVGLPGRRAFLEPSLRLNRAERLMNLMVPTESFFGQLDLIANITDAFGTRVANVRDTFDAAAGTRQMTLTLLPGRYVCNLLVREATGVMYSESIPFQVLK